MESRFGWGRKARAGENEDEEENKNDGDDHVYDDDSSSEGEGGINSTPGGSRIPRDPSHLFKYSKEAAAETQ
jgi:hypothetical protein